PTQDGVITNTASVKADPSDPNGDNNTATAVTHVKPVADLELEKTDAPDPVLAGEKLTYTLKATNHGPSPATGVTVTDKLPAGVVLLSSNPPCTQTSAGLNCALGSRADGASITVTVNVTTVEGGLLINTASVTGNESDSTPSNNTSTAKTHVRPVADLAIVKRSAPDPVGVGHRLAYVLTLTNNGPSAAGAVTVKDPLPAGVELESSQASQGSGCSPAGGGRPPPH